MPGAVLLLPGVIAYHVDVAALSDVCVPGLVPGSVVKPPQVKSPVPPNPYVSAPVSMLKAYPAIEFIPVLVGCAVHDFALSRNFFAIILHRLLQYFAVFRAKNSLWQITQRRDRTLLYTCGLTFSMSILLPDFLARSIGGNVRLAAQNVFPMEPAVNPPFAVHQPRQHPACTGGDERSPAIA